MKDYTHMSVENRIRVGKDWSLNVKIKAVKLEIYSQGRKNGLVS